MRPMPVAVAGTVKSNTQPTSNTVPIELVVRGRAQPRYHAIVVTAVAPIAANKRLLTTASLESRTTLRIDADRAVSLTSTDTGMIRVKRVTQAIVMNAGRCHRSKARAREPASPLLVDDSRPRTRMAAAAAAALDTSSNGTARAVAWTK